MRKKLCSIILVNIALSFIGLSSLNGISSFAEADAYSSSEWSVGRGSNLNAWTFNSDNIVNSSTNWMGNIALYNDADTTLNDDNRPEYTVKATIQGPEISSAITNMYRGICIYYLNDSNWLTALAKWNYEDRYYEIQEILVYGEINGAYYKTTAEGGNEEWRDNWTDGCNIKSTDKMTMTVSITNTDSNTDTISVLIESGSNVASATQDVYSLAKQVPESVYGKPKVGLISFHNAGSVVSNVTFTDFTVTNQKDDGHTPFILEAGNRITSAYINTTVKLPSYTATNARGHLLTAEKKVLDPYGNEVALDKKGKFTPSFVGTYSVEISCTDTKYNESAEPIKYTIEVYPQATDIYLYELGKRPKEAVVGETVNLPKYQYNYQIDAEIKVKFEDGTDIEVNDNSFVPTASGYYFVNVSLDNEYIEAYDLNYNIYAYKNAIPGKDNTTYEQGDSDNSGALIYSIFAVISLSIVISLTSLLVVRRKK